MQLGPATPDNTIQDSPLDQTITIDESVLEQTPVNAAESQSGFGEVQVDNSEQLQASLEAPADTQPADTQHDQGLAVQESAGENFFQTMLKDQEMPASSAMLMVAGLVLAFLIIMRSLIKSSAKRKQQTRSMGNPSERIETIRDHARGSVEPARQAMVDAENLTRRMGAVLDNKAAKIEVLLEEATERIAQLERANRDLRIQQSMAPQTPAPAPQAEPTPESVRESTPVNQQEQRSVSPEALDRARLDQDRAERTWVETDTPASTEPEEPIFRIDRGLAAKPREESPHPLTFPEQVDELATQGFNALEIANKLNRLVGEVELVLNLRRNSG